MQDTSWSAVASWYDDHLSGDDTYHEKVILPNLLRLMDIKKGEKVLDIACGTGYFTRQYHKLGAAASGVDLGAELIEKAKVQSPDIAYSLAAADDLSSFPDNTFEKASCVLAIQNIKNADKAIDEASRVLRPGGRFYIVMNHPAFRIPKASSWDWDNAKGKQYRRIDEYMSQSSVEISMHPGSDESIKTFSFHRPLQYYFKAINKAGLTVSKLEEWISHRKSEPGVRANEEDRIRKEIPLFMVLECTKVKGV